MPLAKDEKIGLLVAGIIGGSALGLFLYREVTEPGDPATRSEAADKPVVDPQPARDAFADQLERAFHADLVNAQVHAEGAGLHIRWTACSKPMIKKLLDKTDDKLTRNVRKLSGLSLAKLKELKFSKLVCDDTAKRVITEAL